MKKRNNMAIVKYDNSFNNLPLKNFTAVEMDLLMTLCNKVKEQGTNDISLYFRQIRELSGYSMTANKPFVKSLENTNKKLLDLKFRVQNENKIIQFVLFPTFEIDLKEEVLNIAVNQKFAYILNELSDNFTRFELEEFTQLNSSYSKALYRLLKQFRQTGMYIVSVEDFRTLLDVPEGYTNAVMNRDILNRSVEELRAHFKNLKVEKIKHGAKITAYKFTFVKESVKQEEEERKVLLDARGGLTCPDCGQMLYEKKLNGVMAWAHLDGGTATAKCNKIFNSVAEIKGYEEKPTRESRKSSGEMSSLGDIFGGLFKKK